MSIKEKAEELVEKRVELSREESIAYSQGIEDGANYVLEQIEEFQKLFLTSMNARANGYLESVIEQLKKELWQQ